ncbi:MAG: nucleotide exchange factor GrpE [Candidatus Eisenbacteria bacterium]|nr:nucleotide exchange factor GrpE [Candidatus Eisenbacteria bacterium]
MTRDPVKPPDAPELETRDDEAGGTAAPAAADASGAPVETGAPGPEDYRDRWMRAAAELDNYRRRTLREREEWNHRRTTEIFDDLLRVRDDFERALAHAPEGGDDPVLSGFRLVYRHLVEFCERHGVTPFESAGEPFDPDLHDAILQVRRPGVEPDTVVEVVLPGYRLGERVLRHARVVVSTSDPGETVP